jgi:mannose-6-phosphate isomerase-like protein (cupin superfamily)
VEELWFITSGQGRMWRKAGDEDIITELKPGLSLLIPAGTSFQFRCDGGEPLQAVGVTMPPWPGADEAVFVEGPWRP